MASADVSLGPSGAIVASSVARASLQLESRQPWLIVERRGLVHLSRSREGHGLFDVGQAPDALVNLAVRFNRDAPTLIALIGRA